MSFTWGIAATGGIATSFVTDLALLPEATVVAVGSRSESRAEEFGSQHGIPHRHATYEALADDGDVDIVYVASPHGRHFEDTMLFLEAGKHVLCEKPLALNARQARAMADTARAQGRFLMEALWSRFLPSYVALRKLLEDGRIGEPLMLDASFGFRAPIDPTHRLFNRALGGGSLLDLGIYPIHLSSLVFGAPEAVQAVGHIGTTAVDESVAAVLRHPSGGITSLRASIRANLPSNAVLSGSDGVVELPTPMHHPRTLVVTDPDGTTTTIDAAHEGNGLRFQAEEVHRCLAAGLHESPVLPLEESCQFAATMDAIRAQIGMRYDAD